MFSLQPTTPQSNTHISRLRQFSGAGNYTRPTWTTSLVPLSRRQVAGNRHKLSVRAVISSEESKSSVTENVSNGGLVSPEKGAAVEVKAVITIRKKMKEKIGDKIEDQWESFITGIGQGILIQLISEDIDPVTKSGKSIESYARGWLPKQSNHRHIVEYAATLTVPSDFGNPGAILITNFHGKEFYLMQIVLHGFNEGHMFFPANTWIHSRKDNPESRIIFKSQELSCAKHMSFFRGKYVILKQDLIPIDGDVITLHRSVVDRIGNPLAETYLPSKTPPGLKDLRREDLLSVRGNGKGVRKSHDRIYDYAPYNDLGNPDKGEELIRPVLGGVPGRPYPRRCRTGRPPTKSDPLSESRIEKPHPVYVPRDETFEEIKQNTFAAGRLKSLLHNLIPLIAARLSSSDISFGCFSEIDKLYIDGVVLPNEEHNDVQKKQIMPKLLTQVLTVGDRLLKYEIPAIIRRDMFAWTRDNEFARQTLAGVNPINIEVLREFPILSKLDPADYGPQESAITKELLSAELQGITIEEAIEKKRLFIIDYHDMFLPFIGKMNNLPGRKAYASRTILFLTRTGVLKPIVIELSLPPKHSSSSSWNKRVFTHGHDATAHWMWKQAKAHVCSNDAGVHQLVNHWLRTHACMEAYIIATHRQLSSMHPIFKLLHPHMRYTLEINAIARQNLINGGGIIEACFSPGKYAMEISSAGYKSWRFDMESLPADLIRRGMAVEDPSMPHGLKLLIEDYPYAADGLLVWSAIKELVEPYVSYYYSEPNSITSDIELQAWWTEIKNKGHYDKRNEPWWPKLETKEDLSGILTIIIWTASGQHAAINFGQYPFGGYVPNRPTLMRKLIPTEEDPEYEKFLHNPQRTFLSSLPTQLQATKIMAVQDTLSTHSADEEYLGQLHHLQSHWGNDPQVLKLFEKFSAKVEEIEKIINKRNKDTSLKNRNGAGVPPYELLLPTSGPGVTGRGIPNSVSI